MSKIIKMGLKEIFSKVDLMLRENDIVYFCTNEKVIKEFIQKYTGRKNKKSEVKQFLIDNEEFIDKERLILLIVKNYKDNLKLINNRIKTIRKGVLQNDSLQEAVELQELNLQYHTQTKMLENALNLGKGIESFLTFYYYDDIQKRYRVEVADSREVIDGKKVNSSKNIKKFDEIDLYFKNGNENEQLGMEYMIQAMILTDLYHVFPNEQFGNDIRTMILENEVIRTGTKTKEELQALKTFDTQEEYSNVIDNVSFKGLLPDIKKTLREYAQYIDIDKLLLLSAYRFNESLEDGYISSNSTMNAKAILQGILANIKGQNIQISCQLQSKKDYTYESQEVIYSVKDVKKCINQFTDKEYLSLEQIKTFKEQLENGYITLFEIKPEYIDVMYTSKELEKLALVSDDNLEYVSIKLGWKNEKLVEQISNRDACSISLLRDFIENDKMNSNNIVQLFMNKKIEAEQLEGIKDIIDLSESINSAELTQYYYNSIKNDATEDEKEQYSRYLELYKQVLIKEKTKEELDVNSNQLIEKIIDKETNRESYVQNVEILYREGVLTLNTLLEWDSEDIVTRLYNDGLINIEDILSLGLKLGFDYIENIYSQLINSDEISYDERIKYIESGFVGEEDVISLYEKGLIMDDDLMMLEKKSIIGEGTAERIIDSRKLEDRIKAARAKVLGWSENKKVFDINGLKKKQNENCRIYVWGRKNQ